MPEKLVDVKTIAGVLHTFPVSISNQTAESGKEDAFKQKALEAAANANLLPNEQLKNLSAEMHTSRSGPLEPYPDTLGVLAETKAGLEQLVRERAYALWEQAGRPDCRTEEFWYRAHHQFLSERAYALWERDGRPDNEANAHWYRMLAFESSSSCAE